MTTVAFSEALEQIMAMLPSLTSFERRLLRSLLEDYDENVVFSISPITGLPVVDLKLPPGMTGEDLEEFFPISRHELYDDER